MEPLPYNKSNKKEVILINKIESYRAMQKASAYLGIPKVSTRYSLYHVNLRFAGRLRISGHIVTNGNSAKAGLVFYARLLHDRVIAKRLTSAWHCEILECSVALKMTLPEGRPNPANLFFATYEWVKQD